MTNPFFKNNGPFKISIILDCLNLSYENILKLNIIPNIWDQIDKDHLVVRFVTSFETTTSQIDEIVARLKTFFDYIP